MGRWLRKLVGRNRRGRLALKGTAVAGAVTVALAFASVGTAGAASKASSGSSYPVLQGIGPRYTTSGGANVLPTTQTVAHWHGSFVDGLNGSSYGFNMVGADPSSGVATTVSTEIIPVNFEFAADNGYELAGGQEASAVTQSPIFVKTALPSGETAQYLDAVMRSEFNKIGSGYHVTLSSPATLPTQTIVVPQNQGAIYQTTHGTIYGLANYNWFTAQLPEILANSGVSPTTLPIVISDDVYLYTNSLSNCCVVGFHGAAKTPGNGGGSINGNGDQPVLTYAWASWVPSPDIFGSGSTDVAPLSHEISEWGHDPFIDNYVNPWSVADEPQYGCNSLLETGDPLVGVDFTAGANLDPATGFVWHLQDEAFLWWFARQPTQAFNGAYSYLGTFTSWAPLC